jgi:hypothetical protein
LLKIRAWNLAVDSPNLSSPAFDLFQALSRRDQEKKVTAE